MLEDCCGQEFRTVNYITTLASFLKPIAEIATLPIRV